MVGTQISFYKPSSTVAANLLRGADSIFKTAQVIAEFSPIIFPFACNFGEGSYDFEEDSPNFAAGSLNLREFSANSEEGSYRFREHSLTTGEAAAKLWATSANSEEFSSLIREEGKMTGEDSRVIRESSPMVKTNQKVILQI